MDLKHILSIREFERTTVNKAVYIQWDLQQLRKDWHRISKLSFSNDHLKEPILVFMEKVILNDYSEYCTRAFTNQLNKFMGTM